jgi:hypothetical protein
MEICYKFLAIKCYFAFGFDFVTSTSIPLPKRFHEPLNIFFIKVLVALQIAIRNDARHSSMLSILSFVIDVAFLFGQKPLS